MSQIDIPAEVSVSGKICGRKNGLAVFCPRNTRYEMHLVIPPGQDLGPDNARIEAVVHASARKIWTVPSGGRFITPIAGTPRIVQGQVHRIDENRLIVYAGAAFIIEMPKNDSALDLARGEIVPGRMINVVLYPGASIEVIGTGARSATPSQPHTGGGPGQT